jgi:hypothetical protein
MTDISNKAVFHTVTTLRASGSLMQTSMLVAPSSVIGEFFTVANPCTSKVTMEGTATGTTAFMYYRDPLAGEHVTYSAISLSSAAARSSGNATRILDPSQAVFFEDFTGGASVIVAPYNKVTGNNKVGVFSANTSLKLLRLKVYQTSRYNNNQSESDGLYIDFNATHNLSIDGIDATQLNVLNANIEPALNTSYFEKTSIFSNSSNSKNVKINLLSSTIFSFLVKTYSFRLFGVDSILPFQNQPVKCSLLRV